ncbi:DUF3703 domain-containing protein [Micromonospora chokoriensis]
MPLAVRAAFDAELATARTATDPATPCRAAERAHILSQPWPHSEVHAAMLRRALRELSRAYYYEKNAPKEGTTAEPYSPSPDHASTFLWALVRDRKAFIRPAPAIRAAA